MWPAPQHAVRDDDAEDDHEDDQDACDILAAGVAFLAGFATAGLLLWAWQVWASRA